MQSWARWPGYLLGDGSGRDRASALRNLPRALVMAGACCKSLEGLSACLFTCGRLRRVYFCMGL